MHAKGAFSPSLLELTELSLHRGEERWVEGRVAVPLATEVESMAERFWLAESPVDVEIRSVPVPVKELMRLLGRSAEEGDGLLLIVQRSSQEDPQGN